MKQSESLRTIIHDRTHYGEHHTVAWRANGALSWRDFNRQVDGWQQQLQSVDDSHIAIYQPAAEIFLACLWATWRMGKIAVISTNGFRDTRSLLPDLHERLTQSPLPPGFALGIDPPRGQPDAADTNSDIPALLLFTSGSSGTPTLVAKPLRQLDAELSMLESLWGESVDGSVFIRTVSHHHMYGLPFGLLWPLIRGSAFYSETIPYAESLDELASHHRITLVTSPVQLDNLPTTLNWPLLQTMTARIFSAGAALSPATAATCLGYFARPVTEIYGSTETGAVAWRQQPADDLWHCLPSVQVANRGPNNQLAICSPAVSNDPDSWLTIADTGEIHSPQLFSLQGRVDRIVKVGGKRVSLSAIENALQDHHLVAAAKVVLLPERKSRLGAVLVLTPAGNALLIDKGKNAVNAILLHFIQDRFERIVLPRYWRYLAKMPVNAQGKITSAALVDLFHPERQPRLPEVIAVDIIDDHQQLILRIPDNLLFFSGHFPGNPVIPGVVQLHWAIHYARQSFPELEIFLRLEAIKFQHIIQPGNIVTLRLQHRPGSGKLQFSFSSPQTQHSSGRILFEPQVSRLHKTEIVHDD